MICYRSCVGCCRNYRQSAKGRAGSVIQPHTSPGSNHPHPTHSGTIGTYLTIGADQEKSQCLNVRERERERERGCWIGWQEFWARIYSMYISITRYAAGVLRCCATTVRIMQAPRRSRHVPARPLYLCLKDASRICVNVLTVPSTQGFSPTELLLSLLLLLLLCHDVCCASRPPWRQNAVWTT